MDDVYERKYVPLTEAYLNNILPEANLDDVLNGKCTVDHAHRITNYSGGLSDPVNHALRCDYLGTTQKLKAFETELAAALVALTAFNDQTVYRMEKRGPAPDVYEKYFTRQMDRVLNMPCYLSTSIEDWNSTKVVYHIKTLVKDSHARDISRITNMAREKEVLFRKNTNFLIKGIAKTEHKLIIDLEETKEIAIAILNYYDDPDATDTLAQEQPGLFD